MMSDLYRSDLIVGAGVFGVSTALQLRRKYPEATVTLVDRAFPYQAAASWDWSKVVRADYPDIFYIVEGKKASIARPGSAPHHSRVEEALARQS